MARRGFTLIELMTVIAVVGILASFVLVNISGSKAKSRDAKRVTDLNSLFKTILNASVDSYNATLTGTNCANNQFAKNCDVFVGFTDPSGSALKCSKGVPRVCEYTIFTAPGGGGTLTNENFEVCGYLESGTGQLPAGNISISSSNSALAAGCP